MLGVGETKKFSVNLGRLMENRGSSSIDISLMGEADQTGSGVSINVLTEDIGRQKQTDSSIFDLIHVESFTLDQSPLGWGLDSLQELPRSSRSARFNGSKVVHDQNPLGSSDEQVLKIAGPGYGLTIESGFSIPLGEIRLADLTIDWLESMNNCGAAPGDIYVVVRDTDGTSRVLYHTADYQARPSTTRTEWTTLDVGRELGAAGRPPEEYSPHYNWLEIAPDSKTYPAPVNGGVTGDPAVDARATGTLSEEATVEAVGIGNGSFLDSSTREIYYDSLRVNGTRITPKPLTLRDLVELSSVEYSLGISRDEPTPLNLELSSELSDREQLRSTMLTIELTHEE